MWSPGEQARPEGEWIEIGFEESVYIQKVNTYQNYYPGAVTRILMKNFISDSWDLLWEGPPRTDLPDKYAIHSPSICQRILPSNEIRLELDTPAVFGWNEIGILSSKGNSFRCCTDCGNR